MKIAKTFRSLLSVTIGCAAAIALFAPASMSAATPPSGYAVHDSVTDATDHNLINPWGMAIGQGGQWTANNGSGTVSGFGQSRHELTVQPGPASTNASPTGLVLHPAFATNSHLFVVTNVAFVTNSVRVRTTNGFETNIVISTRTSRGPARVIVATEDGTIQAWSPQANKDFVIVADRSFAGSVYKGLAVAQNSTNAWWLFAADFHNNKIDIFDSDFNFVASVNDPLAPAGFAPFGIKRILGKLFVAYAKQGSNATEDEPGPGNGYISVFNTDGVAVRQFAFSGGNSVLNSPWGLAQAPNHFGKFSHALLVGNFGDGTINAFNVISGEFLGPLVDSNGTPIVIDGLWSLNFNNEPANGSFNYESSKLFFTAGPNGEQNGVLGSITSNAPMSNR